jgi:hypothetical protein
MSLLEPTTEERMAHLLSIACEASRPCKACGVQLYFIRSKSTQALIPFDESGRNHFTNCPEAARFKQKKHP